MNRKDFIKGSCGICVAMSSGLLVSALLDACKAPMSLVKTTAKDNIIIIPLADFDNGGFKMVRVSNFDYDIAVQKEADGSYEALVLRCTHAGQPLTQTGNTYYCTAHGSQFDHDGHVLKGPAEKSLERLFTRKENNNLLIKLS